jgi:hypothetical protein
MFYLKPFHTNTYNANVEKLSVNNQLNHFCVLPNDRYAVVGTYPFSQTSNLHLYAIKDINANGLMCIPDAQETIGIGVSLNGNQVPFLIQQTPPVPSWSIDTATYTGFIITNDCTD